MILSIELFAIIIIIGHVSQYIAVLINSNNYLPYDCIKFNGGGIYFWWQAGAAKYLLENQLLSRNISVIGSSAGSLTATLLKTNSNFDYAADFAIYQAKRDKLWDSPLGLLGIWGNIVDEWLNELIDDNLTEENLSNLFITATPINIFRGPITISNFKNKKDVISACLVSCHIPLFMNGKIYRKHNNKRYIDGSFWSTIPIGKRLLKRYFDCNHGNFNSILDIKWQNDIDFVNRNKDKTFVSLLTPDGLHDMVDSGYSYMKQQYLIGNLTSQLKINNS